MPEYRDSENFYSLIYPAGWKVIHQGDEVQFRPGHEASRALSIVLHNRVLSAEGLAYQIAEGFAHRLPLYLELARSKIDLNGHPAIWVEQSYSIDDVTERGFMLVVVRNRIGFVITGWAPSVDYDEYQPALKTTALSFQLEEDQEAPLYDLWPSVRTTHSVLRFLPDSAPAEYATEIAAEHEAISNNVLRTLQLDCRDIITAYYYPSIRTLYRSTAWDSEFSIPAAAELHNLWISPQKRQPAGHALTHVLIYCSLGEAGQTLLREGVAVFLDHSGQDPNMVCRILHAEGRLLPLASLVNEGWSDADPQIAYPQAGSFVRYLLETYGSRRFKQIYLRSNLETALMETIGADLKALEKDWQSYLYR